MRTIIPYILSACLTLAFSLVTERSFSQTDQGPADTTSSISSGGTTYVKGLTAGRARSLAGGVVGLISLIIGWRAKSRSTVNAGGGRPWTIAALGLGLLAIILSVMHLANTTGGFGTGGGKAGAIVALVLGLTGTALNGLALRQKRT